MKQNRFRTMWVAVGMVLLSLPVGAQGAGHRLFYQEHQPGLSTAVVFQRSGFLPVRCGKPAGRVE